MFCCRIGTVGFWYTPYTGFYILKVCEDLNMMRDIPVKVLVVEDEEISQITAKYLLGELGCVVDVIDTGYGALEKLSSNDYDIVFMDLGIFDMDGLNIAKKIRDMPGNIKDVPIVAITMYEHDSMRKRAFALGFNDFLIKPLTEESCRGLLEKHIGHSAL